MFILLGCFSCNNKPKKELSVNNKEIDSVYVEAHTDTCIRKVIDNFYKYRDEKRLFEGLEDAECYCLNSFPYDTLLIFNFDEGIIRRISVIDQIDTLPQKATEGEKNIFEREYRYKYINYIKGFPTDRNIIGDFNGNGKIDTTIVGEDIDSKLEKIRTKFNKLESDGVPDEDKRLQKLYDEYSKLQEIYTQGGDFEISFSDKSIAKLKVTSNMDYTIRNEGDLDGDGADEIGFLYGWGTSGCRTYTVYTLKNNKWKVLFEAETTINMRELGIVPVEKDSEDKNVILVRSAGECYCCSYTPYVVEKSVKISELQKKSIKKE
jgi:hypothetical protein